MIFGNLLAITDKKPKPLAIITSTANCTVTMTLDGLVRTPDFIIADTQYYFYNLKPGTYIVSTTLGGSTVTSELVITETKLYTMELHPYITNNYIFTLTGTGTAIISCTYTITVTHLSYQSVASATPDWGSYICSENASFTISEKCLLRYGYNTYWGYKLTAAGTYTASNTWFGGDPYSGLNKYMYKCPASKLTLKDTTGDIITPISISYV